PTSNHTLPTRDDETRITLHQAALVRPSTAPHVFSNNRHHKIIFRHPGYDDDYDQNVLFALFAFDRRNGALHYGTAHLACAIVAGNAWDGYLTETRMGIRIDLDEDDLLCGKNYYFHVPRVANDSPSEDTTYKYPIYPSFEHWAFPHNNLPPTWSPPVQSPGEDSEDNTPFAPPSASNLTTAVLRRDKSCRITNHRDYVERAHLCPRTEADWFRATGMGRYNDNRELAGEYIVDDIANAIALRSDIHSAFDDRKFLVTRKKSKWVVHFLEITYELGRLYHNAAIDIDTGVSWDFLLARFAWTIFPHVRQFVETGVARTVRLRQKIDDQFKELVKLAQSEELKLVVGQGRGRSVSPKKRKDREGNGIPVAEARAVKRRCVYSRKLISAVAQLTYPATQNAIIDEGVPLKHEFSQSLPDLLFESDSITSPTNTSMPLHGIPCLARAHTTEDDSDTIEERRISLLKQRERRKQRPSNPELLCCDYTAADAAQAADLPGKQEFGGAHLCLECLGAEYPDLFDNEEDIEREH
ncbi:hypothetical protein LTR04_003128, partial [Oleoguttula sp. CCFEE 6159]